MSYLSRSMRENSGPRTGVDRAEVLSALSDRDRAALAALPKEARKQVVAAFVEQSVSRRGRAG